MGWVANVATIAASLASIGTGVAGAVKQDKALDAQEDQLKSQAKKEEQAREKARKAAAASVDGGFSGTILAPQGLGGSVASSGGKSTILGGG